MVIHVPVHLTKKLTTQSIQASYKIFNENGVLHVFTHYGRATYNLPAVNCLENLSQHRNSD